MLIKDEFIKFITSEGVDKSNYKFEEHEDFSVISFAEIGELNVVYNVAMVFLKDNDVDIYIRKQVKDTDIAKICQNINEINLNYRGVCFIYNDAMVSVKSFCRNVDKLESLFADLAQLMDIAKHELPNFK